MPFRSQDDNPNSFLVKTDEWNYRLDQDIQPYLEYAAEQRRLNELNPNRHHMQPFAVIPDIVWIHIKTNYGVDMHDPNFMHDEEAKKKFKRIVAEQFPLLLLSKYKS